MVAHVPWAHVSAGSIPASPIRLRWGPCWYGQAAVNRFDTGSIPVTAAFEFSTHVPLTERQRDRPSKPARRVRLPQGTLGDRLTVGRLPLNQAMEVRFLLP